LEISVLKMLWTCRETEIIKKNTSVVRILGRGHWSRRFWIESALIQPRLPSYFHCCSQVLQICYVLHCGGEISNGQIAALWHSLSDRFSIVPLERRYINVIVSLQAYQ
jgi:hypothetical protein